MNNKSQSKFKVGDTVWAWDECKFEIFTSKIKALIYCPDANRTFANLENCRPIYYEYKLYKSKEDCVVGVVKSSLQNVDDEIECDEEELLRLKEKRNKILKGIGWV